MQPWLDSIGTNPTTLNGTTVIPPGITGPTLVSNVGSAYSLRGAYGASITWTFSSNLYLLITTDGTSVIARPTTSTTYKGGAGWIQAMVNGSPVRYNVWVGKPVISGISGNMSPGTSGSYNYYTAQYDSKAAIPYSGFQWELTPTNGNNFTGATTGSLGILFNNTGNYQLRVRATNANGTGDYYSIRLNTSKSSSSSSASSYQVYPNPVSDELTVSLNTSVSQFSPLSPSSGTPSDYTVYLYNASGAIVMQSSSQGGNDVYLDVSGLSNGIYYLLIDSGNGNKPETHKIIVKH